MVRPAAVEFAHMEDIIPAPEACRAIRAAIHEALHCKASGVVKTILFKLTGYNHVDMVASELGDETFLVLEGTVGIMVEATGEVFKYGPGNVGSGSKGTRTAWDVAGPFKKFFVVTAA